MSNNFTTRRHLDLADSSSDSEDSQRCLNADVAFEDSNSLVNNEVDTESLGSAENENIADRPANTVDEDEFKAEWTDTFSIHASYLNLNGKVARTQYIGPPHRWKNINWSTLFLLEGMKVGAFIGVDKPRELPPGQTINLRYQYILLDDNNNHIMEGFSH